MTNRRKAEIILLSATVIWGGTFAIVKGALNDTSPLFFIGVRFLLAAAILIIIFHKKLKGITVDEIQKGSILGILLFFGFSTQTIGLQYTTASKAAFLTGTMVIFTPIFQFIMEKKAPRLGNVIGVVIVTAGLYLLTSPKGSEFNFGDGLNLVCAIVFAVYIVYLDMATQEGDPLRMTFVQICTNGLISILAAFMFEDIFIRLTSNLVLSFGYLVILATMLTTYLHTKWQKETTPTRAAVIFTIEPIFAAAIAYLLLSEMIGSFGIIGGVVIIAGLLISEISDDVPILNISLNLKDQKP
ncbi:MAG: DMT family transporter [Bacteroidetes bacterium]|nr:DMT family transporter [Bacteroidota bacterium]